MMRPFFFLFVFLSLLPPFSNSVSADPDNGQSQGAGQNGGSPVVSLDAYVKYALGEGPDPTEDGITVAIGLSMTPYENPRFANGFSGSVPFTPTDMLPPPVEPVKDNKVSFQIGARYAIREHLSLGLSYDWEGKGKTDSQPLDGEDLENYLGDLNYKFAIGAGYDASILEVPWTTLLGKQPVEVGVVVNNNESNIVYFNSGANPWRYGEQYTAETGTPVEWNTLEYGVHVQGDLQVSPAIQSGLLWHDPSKINGVGPNAGTNIAPAPGLNPEEWPHTEGQPIPSVKIKVRQ